MRTIDIIAGARPNFMKVAPIIHAMDRRPEHQISYRFIHTGQHYDDKLSGAFFRQLGIPEPAFNLEVGSGTQAQQTGKIMERYEALLMEKRCDLCLVVGDVNSTMACAVTAQKLGVPVAHVEAGIRSGDWSMPEEINRLVTDSIANWFFTTSETASKNLEQSGVDPNRIFFVGNTMIDTLLANVDRFTQPAIWDSLKLEEKSFFVLTLHRPSNVDDVNYFSSIIESVEINSRDLPIIFPIHPRAAKSMERLEKYPSNIHAIDPLPYLEFNYLVKHAKAVITDSGGITEEATVMGVPCMTLRDTTERPETVFKGTNELIGTDPRALGPAMDRLFEGKWKKGKVPDKWDGMTAERIVSKLGVLLADG